MVAFDWRGHGETEWLREGAYYHFFDYVADLSALVEEVASGPLTLVGHSMGGTASVLFAASHPDRVERLVLLEGLGPEAPEPMAGPDRTRRWVDAVRLARARPPRVMARLEEAEERLLARNPGLPPEKARDIARWSSREVEGGFSWSFDPVHRTRGPYPFRPESFLEFLRALPMPVLSVEGEGGYRTTDHEERRRAIPGAIHRILPGAGHMIHWLAPEPAAREIARFVEEGGG